MKEKNFAVYIITNKPHGTLYVGVSSDLIQRIFAHKNKLADGFSARYNLHLLVYYELTQSATAAIEREKFIKGKNRAYKIALIQEQNPTWRDLYEDII